MPVSWIPLRRLYKVGEKSPSGPVTFRGDGGEGKEGGTFTVCTRSENGKGLQEKNF